MIGTVEDQILYLETVEGDLLRQELISQLQAFLDYKTAG